MAQSIREVMTTNPECVSGDTPVADAAKLMRDKDFGGVLCLDDDQVSGFLTDRDIALRVVGKGRDGNVRIGEVMTEHVKYCYYDQEVADVVANMGEIQVRRLPVVDRDKRLVGIVSLADAAIKQDAALAGEALSNVAVPGGQHNQSTASAPAKK